MLREYRWSSYRAYAGYASAPGWLTCATLLARVCGPAEPDTAGRRRRGGRGRDIALWLGRRHCGLTLAELGAHTKMTPHAVRKAVSRMSARLEKDRPLQHFRREIETEISRINDSLSNV